jgi:hypothetical protein
MKCLGQIMFSAFLLLLVASVFAQAETREFIIIDKAVSAPLRSAPLDGKELGRIPAGTKVQVFEKAEARSGMLAQTWYRVKYKGKEGWISQYTTMGDIITQDDKTGNSLTARAPNADRPKMVEAAELNKGFMKSDSNLWAGVELYFGPGKMYVGKVLGGNEKYTDPVTGRTFRGLKLQMKSGSIEWKDRDAVISGDWYVKESDPALARKDWKIYER